MAFSLKDKPPAPSGPVIMQVIPSLGAGGAEQGCIDVAAELARVGAISIIVSNGGYRVPEALRVGTTHIQMNVDSKNPFTIWRNSRKLRKLINRYKVDIVHARSRAPAWSCYLACKNSTARFMTTCHAPYNLKEGFWGRWKQRYNSSIAKGERVIAISHFVADYLRKYYDIDLRNIRVIHRGVALEKFHPTAVSAERMIKLSREWRLPDGVSIVMMPGRLTRWKGHHVLIDAMARLNRPDTVCVLIGSDQGRKEYREELERTVKQRKLEGQIRIVDHCNDMPAAYMLATVAVSASIDPEGFGRIAAEAQAMGRPIVATDHGGSRETIVRGETGWLVPPNDAEALAKAIEEALALDPSHRSVLATHAMAHIAANFTKDRMTALTLSVYAELLDENAIRTEGLKKEPGRSNHIAAAA
ncbi:MAG: glycosyltransferase family 4 protein [Micavibrio aeruginosavorus]|uniref:Glycosyltransferase family 4 protein n=1 Tax=Micavibrio aeruginosavorus TaxID=349221 RepID=A0A7T5UHE4_9BACT|nr:MAG: glycosyltransferase family 4 protein [Micavibrio aeruginosavorus]